jgi:hypothetical protein
VPGPVMEPPSKVTDLVPMVNVKPELMFNTFAVPGAVPVPTVKDARLVPDPPFKLTLLFNWTGLFVRLAMVTALVLNGTPALQLPAVSQAFELLPFQASGGATARAAKGANATAAGKARASTAIETLFILE